ncbi:MAG TPA: nitroreductase family protein [Acidimicrobiales bacterium]|nr:nitroreductase family protein [Acidimicrobiales bacterium]
MDTWDAIRARRNVRAYTERPVHGSDLERILRAGWLAPSAKNRQYREFVVTTDRQQLEQLAQVWQWAGHIATSAVTITVVIPASTSARDRELDQFDAGQAVMAMMIEASDLGIGSGHSSVGDQERARAVLGLPADQECACMVAFGYPADRPLAPLHKPDRRPFDEVVHRGHW